jgi:TRAP-type mannitol/chloroaromatic compound transport system permease small subunit
VSVATDWETLLGGSPIFAYFTNTPEKDKLMQALRLYVRAVEKMSETIGLACTVLVPCMVAVLFIEVVSRYIFQRPTLWAYDTAIFLYGYCGLLAGAYVLKHNGHINVDLLQARLPRRVNAVLNVLTAFLFFFLMILIIIYGSKAAIMAISLGDRTPSAWGPPLGHFKLMIPVGALFLLMQGTAKWIRDLYYAITGKELEV